MPARRNGRRVVKPRRADLYTNELYGLPDDDPGAIADGPSSKAILARNLGQQLESKDPWHTHPACELLGPEMENSPTGLFVPVWAACYCKNARLARLMSYVLYLFDEGDDGLCRARGCDWRGLRYWHTTYRRLAADLLMPVSTVYRLAQRLDGEGPIDFRRTTEGDDAVQIRISPYKMAHAYHHVTGSRCAYEEFVRTTPPPAHANKVRWNSDEEMFQIKKPSWGWTTFEPSGLDREKYLPGWYESRTRKEAMGQLGRVETELRRTPRKVRGVWIPDRLMLACERKATAAMVLAQVLWESGLNPATGLTRARILRDGYLWVVRSPRSFERDYGLGQHAVRSALDYLIHQRCFLAKGYWVYDRQRDKGRPTLHLRPRPDAIYEGLRIVEDEVLEVAESRSGSFV